MSVTRYEQFFAVGSVKSLLTGKEFSVTRDSATSDESKKTEDEKFPLTLAFKRQNTLLQ